MKSKFIARKIMTNGNLNIKNNIDSLRDISINLIS